ncbi:mRNA interferase MazF [Streptococcus equinus]|uniref:mRNA interferase MazF n=2 Tax=Streptococcus equinus TaxID=1335 RepID=A0A1H0MIJ0_STREI|nr:mRNA interferase MazF [Streptococcus equinus]
MNKYIPQKQDIIWIDFNPSKGKEIQKRRPALVVSSDNYSKQTGFVAVCPITHGQQKLKEKGLLVEVQSEKVDGFVNPFQLHTFDYKARGAEKITILDNFSFAKVIQLNRFIFE